MTTCCYLLKSQMTCARKFHVFWSKSYAFLVVNLLDIYVGLFGQLLLSVKNLDSC